MNNWLDKYQTGGTIKKTDERYAATKSPSTTNVRTRKAPTEEDLKKLHELEVASRPTFKEITPEEYKRGVKKSEDVKNFELSFAQKPLVYLSNPLKAVGDALQPVILNSNGILTKNPFPTSEEDRKKLAENIYLSNNSGVDVTLQGLGLAGDAAINLLAPEDMAFRALGKSAGEEVLEKTLKNVKGFTKDNKAAIVDLLTNRHASVSIPNSYLPEFLQRRRSKIAAKTIDKALKETIELMSTKEGKDRLVAQELEALREELQITRPSSALLDKAKENARLRIVELHNVREQGNKNQIVNDILENYPDLEIKDLNDAKDIVENNASSTTYRNPDVKWLRDTPVHSELMLGPGHSRSAPTVHHEIAHEFQKGKELPMDKRLGKLEPIEWTIGMPTDVENAATYFYSNPLERSAFLTEARETMLKRGIIKKKHQNITPEIIEKAYKKFKKKRSVKYLPAKNPVFPNGKLIPLSTARIFDFMAPTQSNFELIAREMNKLRQLALPIVGGATAINAAAEDNKKRNGGWLEKYQDGGEITYGKTRDSILNANKNKNFIKRVLDPSLNKNREIMVDGYDSPSTHLMTVSESDGKYYVYPTVFDTGKEKLEYIPNDKFAAFKYAKKNNEFIEFDNEEDALNFSKNYKTDNFKKTFNSGGNVINDNRGQWAHPGKVTKIDSNLITMKGVNYPVLGVSDTGDTKLMLPNQDYKFQGKNVTEYPMAKNGGWLEKYQDGGVIKVPEKKEGNPIMDWWYNNEDVNNSFDYANKVDEGWMSKWFNHPETRRRLIDNQGRTPEEADKLLKTVNDRLENLTIYDDKKVNYNGTDFIYNHKLNNLPTNNDEFSANRFLNSASGNVEGVYKDDFHSIILQDINKKGVIAHEMAHGLGKMESFQNNSIIMNNDKIDWEKKYEEYKEYPGIYKVEKKYKEYLDKDGLYPRIMDIRRQLNVSPGDIIDKEKLNSIKSAAPLKDLKDYFTEEQILNILNTIADTSSNQNSQSNIAKNGRWLDKYSS